MPPNNRSVHGPILPSFFFGQNFQNLNQFSPISMPPVQTGNTPVLYDRSYYRIVTSTPSAQDHNMQGDWLIAPTVSQTDNQPQGSFLMGPPYSAISCGYPPYQNLSTRPDMMIQNVLNAPLQQFGVPKVERTHNQLEVEQQAEPEANVFEPSIPYVIEPPPGFTAKANVHSCRDLGVGPQFTYSQYKSYNQMDHMMPQPQQVYSAKPVEDYLNKQYVNGLNYRPRVRIANVGNNSPNLDMQPSPLMTCMPSPPTTLPSHRIHNQHLISHNLPRDSSDWRRVSQEQMPVSGRGEFLEKGPDVTHQCEVSDAIVNPMLTILEKLVDRQKGTEEVLQTLATGRKGQAVVLTDLKSAVPTFAGDNASQARAWLKAANPAAITLNWPEEYKLDYCTQQLRGAAKFWFDRVNARHEVNNWPAFETTFQRTYCIEDSQTEFYDQMRAVKQFKESNLEVYFQKKAKLCEECRLSFKDAKREIIDGLTNRELALQLRASKHTNYEEMYDDIQDYARADAKRAQEPKGTHVTSRPNNKGQEAFKNRPSWGEKKYRDYNKSNFKEGLPPYNDKLEPLCFRCQIYGHYRSECPREKRPLKCLNCQGLGHTKDKCPKKQSEGQKQVNAVSSSMANKITFEKPVLVNDTYALSGLVDSGSTCSIIRKSAAAVCQLQPTETTTELYGFGSEGVGTKTLGKCNVKVEVDGIILIVPLYATNDASLSHDLLIGNSFLDHKEVAFVKLGDKFHIGKADQEPFVSIELPEVPSTTVKIATGGRL
jgi:hypothetical protein